MSVSVIIPAWNAEKTLSGTIDSALRQGAVSKIVVIDDGSTDGTARIASGYDTRLELHSVSNAGVSAARNLGIQKSDSEWIIFLDSDDLLVNGTVEKRLEVARHTGADVIITDWQDFSEDKSGNRQLLEKHCIDWTALEEDAEIATATHVWATTAAIMYRRTIVEKTGGFREDLPVIQDARFLFDAAYHGAAFAHADHVGASYRIIPGSLSRRSKAEFHADILHNGLQIETSWRSDDRLTAKHRRVIAGIYNTAARGLLAASDPRYFDAVAAQKALNEPLPRHTRFFYPFARMMGLSAARCLAEITGKI